jgi:hypothetical protein
MLKDIPCELPMWRTMAITSVIEMTRLPAARDAGILLAFQQSR